MKLRNKKTGEIVETVIVDHGAEWELRNEYTNEDTQTYTSLAELNAEWEDYKEPKDYWWISPVDTDVVHCVEDVKDEMDQYNKEIGNYFETKEEAEKAVEKLKAWKRLKDEYGFKFTGWKRDEQYKGDFIITAQDWNTSDDGLLELLFGGDE